MVFLVSEPGYRDYNYVNRAMARTCEMMWLKNMLIKLGFRQP